jgi:hypothetical protein
MLENGSRDRTERFVEEERKRFEDVKAFLDANGEASARTRNIIVVLIVASVLTAVGILNSLQGSWMVERIEHLRNCNDAYLAKYMGPCPTNAAEMDLYQRRYLAFTGAASAALVDNRFHVHVPFFGLSFDVNDLGMLAGVGLVSILLLLRFSAGTELENLKLSFSQTKRLNCFPEFYRLAAMRQVLTIPRLPDRKVRWTEKWLAKPVYFVPVGVYVWLFIHDIQTYWLGHIFNPIRMEVTVWCEGAFLIAVIWLACGCFRRSNALDATWDAWWDVYCKEADEPEENSLGDPQPTLDGHASPPDAVAVR